MSITQTILRSRAVAALTSPHGVDRYLEIIDPMWSVHEVRGRVVDVRRETGGDAPVATITLQPTTGWRGHRAGQYVQVGVDLPGSRRTTRCFTISSAASAPGEPITLTVRSNVGERGLDSVSRYLVEDARPGTVVHLSQAEGGFCLDESPATPTNNHLLFITGGSGITPAMSMVRTLLRDGYDGRAGRKVTFLHYARTAEDQIFAEELARIAEDDNDVTVHLRHGDGESDSRFSEFELRRLVPTYRDTDTWACGPAPMLALVEEAYAGTGRLRTETFKIAGVVPSGAAEGDVAFSRSGEQAPNSGASLLEQAEALGLKPEFGCRMGICFSCTATKSSGTVRNVLTGEESSLPDEQVRICVNAPVGDCVVDL